MLLIRSLVGFCSWLCHWWCARGRAAGGLLPPSCAVDRSRARRAHAAPPARYDAGTAELAVSTQQLHQPTGSRLAPPRPLTAQEWWNATTVGEYWRLWNQPVHKWMLRHVYFPSIRTGLPKFWAGAPQGAGGVCRGARAPGGGGDRQRMCAAWMGRAQAISAAGGACGAPSPGNNPDACCLLHTLPTLPRSCCSSTQASWCSSSPRCSTRCWWACRCTCCGCGPSGASCCR